MKPSLAVRIKDLACLRAAAEKKEPLLGSNEHLAFFQPAIRASSCGTSISGGGQYH